MYQFLTKNGQVAAFGLGVALTVIFLAIALSGAGNYNFETMSPGDKAAVTIFDFGLQASIALAVIATLAMVFFGVYQVATDLKNSMKGLLGLAAMVGIFVVTYSMASGEPDSPQIAGAMQKFAESGNGVISPSNLKFIGGSIMTTFILLAAAVGALVITGVRNLFK
jgi:hypothetical protein